jgi:hypothetical protein
MRSAQKASVVANIDKDASAVILSTILPGIGNHQGSSCHVHFLSPFKSGSVDSTFAMIVGTSRSLAPAINAAAQIAVADSSLKRDNGER